MSLEYARQVMDAEAAAIRSVRNRLDAHFIRAVEVIAACRSRICTCGMGKAGIVAQKVAATLSSTGTPSYYLHPADALHGDLGMVSQGDVVVIFSNSGESDEVSRLLPCFRQLGVTIVAITSSERSTLAAHADNVITLGVIEEACPLGLAPSATTTAMLALGDTLALTVMKRRGFEERDYAKLHPAGALGRRLLPVENVMRIGDAIARVTPETPVRQVILAMTRALAPAAVVVDKDGHVLGIFCDGDLRRGLESGADLLDKNISDTMSAKCTTVTAGTLAGKVLDMMRDRRISDVPVVDTEGVLLGVADMKGLVASI